MVEQHGQHQKVHAAQGKPNPALFQFRGNVPGPAQQEAALVGDLVQRLEHQVGIGFPRVPQQHGPPIAQMNQAFPWSAGLTFEAVLFHGYPLIIMLQL